MRRVVVNTTPLIALSGIGKLNILKDMYGEIFIPKAVYDEVKLEPAYSEVNSSLDWINVVDIDNNVYAKMFSTRLHAGEVEAIMYAIDTKADLIVLDDKLARKTAKYMGLTVTGTLGVVIKAKEIGYIEAVKPIMNMLIQNGLYISADVQKMVLDMVDE